MMAAPTGGQLVGVASIDAIVRFARSAPVFPCRAVTSETIVNGKPKTLRAKAPHIPEGFLKASQDEQQIRAWWKRWPDALVGVPMGQATGLVAVDYDSGKHSDATGEWLELHADALMAARIHSTMRAGRHYVYRVGKGQRYRTGSDLTLDGKPRPGIDLRAEGGYVIWWPLHGGTVTNDEAPLLPAGLIDERAFTATPSAPEPRNDPSPAAWAKDRALVIDALAYVDPALRDTWTEIGMALHLATSGNDEGFDLWHTWSAGGITGEVPASYGGLEDCRYHWASFKDTTDKPVTLGTLFHYAKKGGWQRTPPAAPPVAPAEAEDSTKEDPQPDPPQFIFHTPSVEGFTGIEPRQFLYRRHYMRKMIGITAAAGGAGKSSVVLVELVSLSLGRDLLDGGEPLKAGRQVVWYHNGEDPDDEIRRRLSAICIKYEIDPAELSEYFFWTIGRQSPLIVAEEYKGEVMVRPATVEGLTAELKERGVSVLCLDPLISTHRVSENSNESMEVVMWQWRQVADTTGCAIEAIHHFRKSNGQEASVDDIRGASSMIGAARSARIFGTMTRDEAANAGLDARERRRFLWEGQAKANMYVAADERLWRELVSVDLDNAAGPYESDKVGVACEWSFPNTMTSLADEHFAAIMGAIRMCSDPMKRRASVASTGWIGNLIAATVGVDTKDQSVRKQIASQVRAWQDRGLLVAAKVFDSRQGRDVDVLTATDRVN